MKTYVHTKTWTQMFITPLFVTDKKWKQSKCPSANEWINKMVYPYNVILFSHKKEWSNYIYYNMDEPWKHYAKWKKPDTKDHIVYDPIYMKCPI